MNGLDAGFAVGPDTSVDEVLIKVNSQKHFDWMTSLDFSSYGDSYIKAMVYNELLYVSMGSGNSTPKPRASIEQLNKLRKEIKY